MSELHAYRLEPIRVAARPPRDSVLRHLLLLVATAATTTLMQGWSYSVALLAILLAHESGHYFFCRWYRIDASLPYLLPAPPPFFFGTFGAFIRIRSPFPHRDALFDVGAAGPWAGFVVALVVMVIGLQLSTVTSVPPEPLAAVHLGNSLLVKGLMWLRFGALPDGTDVMFHPVALAGWAGFLVTSLNLLPAGQLDGGHVLVAAGVRSRAFPLLLVVALAWLAWFHWPGWALWAAILLFMTFLGHPRTMNDARPLSRGRRVGAALSMGLLVLTFVPYPIELVR